MKADIAAARGYHVPDPSLWERRVAAIKVIRQVHAMALAFLG